jgi:adenylylsulfate kinase-like enzyme
MTMDEGGVIWITGLSGSGKSALARHVVATLRERADVALFLDGDALRSALSATDFDVEARQRLSLQYARLAWLLAGQGAVVVVATISLFHAAHDLNRSQGGRYLEVIVHAGESLRRARAGDQRTGPRVGREIPAEWPRAPHLELRNDADPRTLHALATQVVDAFRDVAVHS